MTLFRKMSLQTALRLRVFCRKVSYGNNAANIAIISANVALVRFYMLILEASGAQAGSSKIDVVELSKWRGRGFL